MSGHTPGLTDGERIAKLSQALIAARYEIVYWASQPYYTERAHRHLDKNLAKYDAVIEAAAVSP